MRIFAQKKIEYKEYYYGNTDAASGVDVASVLNQNNAQVFKTLVTDDNQPKGGPFGFHMLVDDKLYFGYVTFKNVFKQLTENSRYA